MEDMEDKRGFRRYSYQSACDIRIDGDVYKGSVVDYSDGLGIIAENAPLLKKGIVVDIKIFSSGEQIKGQIAWVKDVGGDVRLGIKRLGNLKGDLKDFKYTDLLIGIQRGTKTGILEIVGGSIIKRVYIKNGDMIFADSSLEDDRLGEWLVMKGKITIEQFNLASKRLIETGEKLGKILVDMSCLTPRELYQAVQEQVEEIILSLFTMEEGAFTFKDGSLPAKNLITLIISAANIIYRGMKRIKSITHIKQMLPSPEAVLDVSQDPMDIFQSVSLDETDKQILSSINGRDSLGKIFSLSPSNDFETLKTISAFLSIGIIIIMKEDIAHAIVSARDILKEPVDIIPEEFVTNVEEMYAKCESADYYNFLGIGRKATDEEIQKAYYRISKQFHPDRHFTFPEHDTKSKLINIFTFATEANNILLDPERREIYNRTLFPEEQNISTGEETDFALHEEGGVAKEDLLKTDGDNNRDSVIGDVQQDSGQQAQGESETRYELGVAYMEMGLVEDAIKEFRLASNDHSKRVKCIKEIARYYVNEEDYQKAMEEFEQLLSDLSPDNKECLDVKYELADIHVKTGEYDKARKLYSEIQSEDPKYRDIEKKIKTVWLLSVDKTKEAINNDRISSA